jgi:tetratricopeptide (TPR) repeat protein
MKTSHKQVEILPKKLLRLEKSGRYEESLSELEDIWEDRSAFPKVEDFEPRLAAEIVLRCGSLIGFLGHIKQIPNSQEKSKNLLTEARNRFLEIYDIEKIAECENYLALAYWRTGELIEAETWIQESLTHTLPNSSGVKMHSIIIKCLISLSLGKDAENIRMLGNYKKDFLTYADNCLKGDFYNHYGLALKNLGETPEALVCLEKARHYHRKSKHQIYLGTVENNLAQLYKAEKNFTKAHQAVDNALNIYQQIKDKTRSGSSLDTKAQIYFAEKKFDQALEMIERSIEILEHSENVAYLIESYLTKIRILISLNKISEAGSCLVEAVPLAQAQISEQAGEKLLKEFEKSIKEKIPPVISQVLTEKQVIVTGVEDTKLVLPPELSHYKSILGVWIKNTHLESVGLKKDSLAIVAEDEEIKRGDLVAVLEIKYNTVSCGFYDMDFGFVCLEGVNSETQLFSENEIEILGKIIGVGESKTEDGRMQIKPILA